MTSRPRPRASDTDKAIFTELLNKISAADSDSYFCCGGTIEFHNRPLSLYYRSKGNEQTVNCLDFLLSSEEFKMAVDKLVDSCVPAPHGRGNKTVYDDSYRLAKELPQNDFSLSLEILGEVGSRVLSAISELISGRETSSKDDDKSQMFQLESKLYKLNTYSEGGFFKSHRDTPKGSNHVGTLLIGLPVAFEGGVLRVAHSGKEIKFDWGSRCSEGVVTRGNGDFEITIPWAFLFSDVEHEVLPVLSGTRVTIAYDIFRSEAITPKLTVYTNDICTFPLSDDINSALHNPNFLPEGAKVAIALSHAYPMPRRKSTLDEGEVASNLKGSDAILYRDMRSLGLDVALEAVFEMDSEQYYDPSFDMSYRAIPEDQDGYGPTKKIGEYRTVVYYMSKEFTFMHGNAEFGDSGESFETFLKTQFGTRLADYLMWIKKPTDTFTEVGSYLAYANQYSIDYCYAAVALVVTIPPYGQGPRKREL